MRGRIAERSSCLVTFVFFATVMSVGCHKPMPPLTLACSASPPAIYPGESVTVSAIASGAEPKKCLNYSWTGDGVTGEGHVASVATSALAAGTYTVNGEVGECRPAKAVRPTDRKVSCAATFQVKAFEPPTVHCTATPSTIKPGETASITAIGVSPQNRPLTFSYSASAGAVTGSGTQAAYNSVGAPTGVVAINCNTSDDKRQTATASTTVTIVAPPPPPVLHTQALCSVSFEKDKKRPTRVDNEAKACLDEMALNLQRQPDAKAVVVGEASIAEAAPKKGIHAKAGKDIAAQRAVNVKEYLVMDKGIDASRVSVAKSGTEGQKVENYLVPAGASFTADVMGTTSVGYEVKAEERKPLGHKTVPMNKPNAGN
jgi:outer membrane protein OmpA-like peptidoglycan-associated protein